MSEREMLEYAARACGLNGFIHEWINGPEWVVPGENPKTFNPLHDDGDALRLAVKLNFRIDILPWGSECASWNAKSGDAEPKGADHFAATRRAIVRAAAEIGRAM